MILWTVFALMTATAIFAVLWPVIRKPRLGEAGSDVAVYRDQLQEIERDVALGLIAEAEAQSARTEVSRRMLSAAGTKSAPAAPRGWLRGPLMVAAAIMLPLGTGSLYLSLGSPNFVSQPIAARVENPHQGQSITELVARVEAYLDRNPEDGRGWEVLAPVYLTLGKLEEAVNARRKALAYNGETAERQADLGETIAAAANGTVTAEARATFERAVVLDASEVKARYYLGVAAEQDGRPKDAAAIWRDMLAGAPAQANWLGTVRAALARVEGEAAGGASATPAAVGKPAPSPEPAEAGRSMAAASGPAAPATAPAATQPDAAPREDPIRGMVARLADRLKTKGGDAEEWGQLVRSYLVLGDRDKALEAANQGESALAPEPEKVERLRALVKAAGLER